MSIYQHLSLLQLGHQGTVERPGVEDGDDEEEETHGSSYDENYRSV